MPANYLEPFANKRLNEVIIPGSHDAGIYGNGKNNVITQELDIGQQAAAGVRFFDLRIATLKTGIGPWSKTEQRAYHLDQSLIIGKKSGSQSVAHAGGWGDSLTTMLTQAKNFVAAYPSEFLILKFSKCFNLEGVIDSCLTILGDKQFNPRAKVNLNMMLVKSLRGKVITLFAESDLRKLNLNNTDHRYSGLIPFRELYDKETGGVAGYDRWYNGMQYFGKFSSTSKIKKNTSKQRSLMETGALGADRDAMGMMYWTTTGILGNIKKRNAKMWSGPNGKALEDTWSNGLELAIRNQMGRDFQNAVHGKIQHTGTNGWKVFMPNIVMMDFSNAEKCDTILRLNYVADREIARFVEGFSDLIGTT